MMAKIPATCPGPMMATSSRPQMIELIEREATMTSSATGRTRVADGVVLRAARKASGTARTTASSVPRVAMLTVSHSGHHSSER